MIGFDLTPAQQELREAARRLADDEIVPRRQQLDEHGCFPREIFELGHRLGFVAGFLPPELGGRGLTPLDMALVAEEVAYGDAGVGTSMFAQYLAGTPVLRFGTEAQQRRWLAPLSRSLTFCSFAWTEPDGSNNSFHLRTAGPCTVARRTDGGYLLSGTKCFITNAPVASFFVVFARVEPVPPALTAFLVPADAPGVQVSAPHHKMGQRASATGTIELRDVAVAEDQRLGAEGQGVAVALAALARSRTAVGAMGVGVARAARDAVVEWGHGRVAGNGQPLILQQDFRFRIAEMDVQIEAARLLTWRACWEIAHGDQIHRFTSGAKLFAGGVATAVTSAAVEMLGGLGYMVEGGVEKLMRDAKLLEIYEGPPAIQKMLVAEFATKRSRRGADRP